MIDLVKKEVLNIITNSVSKLTPYDIRKKVNNHFGFTHNNLYCKTAISELILEEKLAYTYVYGRTFIEKSFNKPVRISEHVVLKPFGKSYESDNDIVITLNHGASFGTGSHPTTRLCIKGIEHVCKKSDLIPKNDFLRCIDIGTGSGVLAIVAVSFGISEADGIDIDPCSINEAKQNVKINRLENYIKIYDTSIDNLNKTYELVTANLRYPTIVNLYPTISKMTVSGGYVVISGIKKNEVAGLINLYTRQLFNSVLTFCDQEWACVILKKYEI